jgi:hypothetical protein
MSTRAQIEFTENGKRLAMLYRHFDGYPTGLGQDLLDFINYVQNKLSDNRFNDPEYLAAKCLVFLLGFPKDLKFLGIGVCNETHGDIDYFYRIECGERNQDGTPVVSYVNTSDSEERVYLNRERGQTLVRFMYNNKFRTVKKAVIDFSAGFITGIEIESGKYKKFLIKNVKDCTFEI